MFPSTTEILVAITGTAAVAGLTYLGYGLCYWIADRL